MAIQPLVVERPRRRAAQGWRSSLRRVAACRRGEMSDATILTNHHPQRMIAVSQNSDVSLPPGLHEGGSGLEQPLQGLCFVDGVTSVPPGATHSGPLSAGSTSASVPRIYQKHRASRGSTERRATGRRVETVSLAHHEPMVSLLCFATSNARAYCYRSPSRRPYNNVSHHLPLKYSFSRDRPSRRNPTFSRTRADATLSAMHHDETR